MAVVRRATSPTGEFRTFGSRLPTNIYNEMSEWAYGHRMSLSAAVTVLLEKAMAAEQYGEYVPYTDTEESPYLENP